MAATCECGGLKLGLYVAEGTASPKLALARLRTVPEANGVEDRYLEVVGLGGDPSLGLHDRVFVMPRPLRVEPELVDGAGDPRDGPRLARLLGLGEGRR